MPNVCTRTDLTGFFLVGLHIDGRDNPRLVDYPRQERPDIYVIGGLRRSSGCETRKSDENKQVLELHCEEDEWMVARRV